jgi:hypothetical protein
VRSADEDNPKGYFEDERIKALGQSTDKAWLRRARGRAVKVISYLLKDLPPDNNYKVIFLRRDLREVLASQEKMLERRNEVDESGDERMLELWENHLWRVKYLLKHADQFETLEVAYSDVIGDPIREARRIRDFLDLKADPETMAAAVDENLYRNRA